MSSSVVDIFKGKTANQIAIEHGDTGSPRKPSQSKITFEGPDLIWVKSANYKGEFSEQYKGMPMMRLSQNDFEKRFPKRTAEQYKQIRSSSVSLEAQMFEEELKTWASKLVKDESSAVVNLAMPDSEPRTPEGIARPAPTAHPVDSVAAQLTQKKQDQPSVSPRSWVDESKTAVFVNVVGKIFSQASIRFSSVCFSISRSGLSCT